MYNVVLMMALTGSGEVPDCHRHNCYGGCQGTVVVSGCTGTVVSTSGYGCRGGCVGTYVTSGGCVARWCPPAARASLSITAAMVATAAMGVAVCSADIAVMAAAVAPESSSRVVSAATNFSSLGGGSLPGSSRGLVA